MTNAVTQRRITARKAKEDLNTSPSSKAALRTSPERLHGWICSGCTAFNASIKTVECETCRTPRGGDKHTGIPPKLFTPSGGQHVSNNRSTGQSSMCDMGQGGQRTSAKYAVVSEAADADAAAAAAAAEVVDEAAYDQATPKNSRPKSHYDRLRDFRAGSAKVEDGGNGVNANGISIYDHETMPEWKSGIDCAMRRAVSDSGAGGAAHTQNKSMHNANMRAPASRRARARSTSSFRAAMC